MSKLEGWQKAMSSHCLMDKLVEILEFLTMIHVTSNTRIWHCDNIYLRYVLYKYMKWMSDSLYEKYVSISRWFCRDIFKNDSSYMKHDNSKEIISYLIGVFWWNHIFSLISLWLPLLPLGIVIPSLLWDIIWDRELLVM